MSETTSTEWTQRVPSGLLDEFGASILEIIHRNDLDGIIFYRKDGTIAYVNDAASRLFGINSEVVGSNFVELSRRGFESSDATIEGLLEHRSLAREALNGTPTRGDLTVRRSVHPPRIVEAVYGPVRADSGDIIGLFASYREVTEQREIARQLRQQSVEARREHAFLESVMEAMDDGLIVLNRTLELQLVNAAAVRLMGGEPAPPLPLEEAIGRSRLLSPEVFARQCENTATNKASTSSVHLVENGGELKCLELNLRYTGIDGREVVGMLRDVTEWQELQQVQLLAEIGRLGAQKGCFQTFSEKILDLLFERLNVDIAVLAIFERGRLSPVGWRGLMLEPELALDPLENYYVRQAIQDSVPVEGDGAEWDGSDLTGTHFVVPLVSGGEAMGTLHLGALQTVRLFDRPGTGSDPAGSFERLDRTFLQALGSYVAAALKNVRLFEQHEEEKARLETLVRRIPDGVLLYAAQGDVLLANEAARDILEFDLRNLNSDSRPYRIKDTNSRPLPRAQWPFFKAVRTGGDLTEETVMLDFGDRIKHVQVSVVRILSPDGQTTSFLGTVQDVTERSEQDRRKDDFLTVASHELRSPLTPLKGFLQMIRKQVKNGQVDETLVRRSEEQVARLSRLIDLLLDMTRIESGGLRVDLETVDLCALVEAVVEPWSAHPSQVVVEARLPSKRVLMKADPARLDQLLTNLIDNAVKYSVPDSVVEVQLSRGKGVVHLSVIDRGVGIEPACLDQIFERFYQQHPGHHPGSMGLGLYISRQIVEAHGGTISIESERGEGTEVTIEFPALTQ